MLLNIFHFIAILTTFILVLAGNLKFAMISFCLALFLTTFTLVGRKKRSRRDNRKSNKQQLEDDSNLELAKVSISKACGGAKKFEKHGQGEIRPTNIQIDNRLQKTGKQPFQLIWCWILLLLGIATWGTYNFIYRDEPYVPLSRVYENIVPFSKNTYLSSNAANAEGK